MNENTFYQYINLNTIMLSGKKCSNVKWKKKKPQLNTKNMIPCVNLKHAHQTIPYIILGTYKHSKSIIHT